MREPAAFVETPDGRYLVFDRRAQSVFSVDATKTSIKKIIAIGPSDGEILRPLAFINGPDRTFFILDNPGAYDRVQRFYDTGTPLSAFRRWPVAGETFQLNSDAMISSGFGAMTAIGGDLLAALPDGAALMGQLSMTGQMTRKTGVLRQTGFERDPAVHRALNAGRPLVAPDGSLYFIFTTGVPVFRKYSAAGELLFERHVEGPELDGTIQSLPTEYQKRTIQGREFPNVTTTVRTAAIDPLGRLWISLTEPFTYVYDADGNKVRTIQFRGAGIIAPSSFFFAKGGRVLVTPGCYEFTVN